MGTDDLGGAPAAPDSSAAPAPQAPAADQGGGEAPAAHPLMGAGVVFVPPINASYPTLTQVPSRVIAVHGEQDVTIFTEDGTEYRCPLFYEPVEEAGSGLFAVLDTQS